MKLIKSKKSPNHYNGRSGWKADMIVFHQTGGSELAPALNWYLNPNAQCSPNWVIDTNGDIYELVNPDNAAFCNGTTVTSGNLNYKNATSEIVKSRATNANYYTYSMECVHCAKGDINEAQVTDLEAESYTATIKIRGSGNCTFYGKAIDLTASADWQIVSVTVPRPMASESQKMITVRSGQVCEVDIAWVKLEEGAQATAYQVPNSVLEKLKCQRYYLEYIGSEPHVDVGVAVATSENSAIFNLFTPIAMAGVPTIEYKFPLLIQMPETGLTATPEEMTVQHCTGNLVVIELTGLDRELTENSAYRLNRPMAEISFTLIVDETSG